MAVRRCGFLSTVGLLAAILVILVMVVGEMSAAGEPEGAPVSLDFPRLGMWWPDPWEQSLSDIARYDWVILGDWASEFITPLRSLNPDILLLNSTNACELGFDPDPDPPPWANVDVLKIPPEWFLTQVGSTLTAPVDETATLFPVAEVTVTDGLSTYQLFVVSDTVLIEGESVLVEAVDEANKVLTVRRGYVRPAAAHAAGARLAAHITFWPDSWLLNLSTLCPAATVSATVGPEIWADYNARVAVGLVESAPWDGILLDRSDPNESWLIGNSTARTIDPDQSNTLLTDYAAFDQAWNEGLRRYESALRGAVGDRIVFVNWGMANYDQLNGNNFEGFPDDEGTAYGRPWTTMVFGPTENGSYFEWIERAQDPNLTMIETYEDDGGPDPVGGGGYDNPCDDPGFSPNYRKMRFGLATALLNDGFFSYEINTNGHGSLCLLWFDEYDGGSGSRLAGAGRGYLGQPLGPAFQAIPELPTPNLLGDSTFEESLGGWDLWADNGYSATVALDGSTAAQGNSSARIDVSESLGTDWQVSFFVSGFEVVSGTEYTLSFWAKADRARPIGAWLQQDAAPWTNYLWYGTLPLTTTWQYIELSGVAHGDDPAAVFHFGLGEVTGTVWLDGVRLQEGSRQVWRRDYEGGLALANATNLTQTLSLGATYQKIAGTQAPEVNDGSLVSQVTLPPRDGLILLRPLAERLYLPLVSRSGSSTPPSGFLHVQGRDILDGDGQPVTLRGVNMDTYYYSYVWDPAAPWNYATQEDIQYLDSLGVTAIRLGLHWRYFETPLRPGSGQALGYDLIDAYLDWCEQAGIYVILDMHVVPPEDDILQGEIWDNPAAQQQFLDLWTAIASRYAERPIVAGYDIYNEPAPPDAAQWWDLADRAVAAIRSVDADHILFVENPLLDVAGFQLLTDPNVVYSYHDYTPFAVSHAAADWVGDTPVPDDYAYPGPALTDVEWADWSPDAAEFTGQSDEWLYWDSGLLTPPPGVEFATLKPSAWGDVGPVWFDDLELLHNGVAQMVFNPGAEDASRRDVAQPAVWGFWSDSGFSGEWSSETAHSGTYSLKITGDGDGYGVWTQEDWILTEPLFRVQEGDTFQVRGWLLAPDNNGGGVSLGLDYLNGVYEDYDRDRLLADIQPYLDWAAAHNAPLHVGEFGCMSAAPGDSRYNLVADKISVMNEAGLHWALWTYRNPAPPGFGLYHGDDLDEPLAEILRPSQRTNASKLAAGRRRR